jgi:hypothetical protein
MPRRTRRPTDDPDPATARAEREARALEEPLDVRLRSLEPCGVLEVRNPIHRTAYLVLLPEYPAPRPALCTCTDFARRGLGTCKHVEAAVRWLVASPGARPTGPAQGSDRTRGFWEEIDRRVAAMSAGSELSARDLARVADLLGA